jgi:hypothetical protein
MADYALATTSASGCASGGAKANNPKDAFGTLKACLSWLPMEVVFEVALALAEGGFKYGGHNYLVAEPRASVYMDACDRHQFQFWNLGEETDAESKAGLHHISKAIASLMVLRAAQIHGGGSTIGRRRRRRPSSTSSTVK